MQHFIFNEKQFQFIISKILKLPAEGVLEIIDVLRFIEANHILNLPDELSDSQKLMGFLKEKIFKSPEEVNQDN